jgi:hypothetical protein
MDGYLVTLISNPYDGVIALSLNSPVKPSPRVLRGPLDQEAAPGGSLKYICENVNEKSFSQAKE